MEPKIDYRGALFGWSIRPRIGYRAHGFMNQSAHQTHTSEKTTHTKHFMSHEQTLVFPYVLEQGPGRNVGFPGPDVVRILQSTQEFTSKFIQLNNENKVMSGCPGQLCQISKGRDLGTLLFTYVLEQGPGRNVGFPIRFGKEKR